MLVMVMVKVAVEPLTTACVSGVLEISMAGLITSTKAVSVSVTWVLVSTDVPVTVAVLVKSAATLMLHS